MRGIVWPILLAFATAASGACGNDGTHVQPSALTDGGTTDAPSSRTGDMEPGAPPAKLDALLEPLREAYGVPGFEVLVLRGGGILAEGAAGVRKLGDPTPVAVGDAWYLGGNAHAMTATLAALAVEEGKLTWTSTVGSVLTNVPMHASYKNVTLEQVLGHQGGAPSLIPTAADRAMRTPGPARARREEGVRAILAAPPEGQGIVHRSDASYLIAGVMLEQALGASWEDLLQTRVFDRLGMSGCSYEARAASSGIVEPWGHMPTSGALNPVAPGSASEPPPAFGPAGRVRCPLRDWSKFVSMHLAGARGEPTALLGASSFAKLQTPLGEAFSQALGWNVVSRTWSGIVPALNHESRAPLFLALVWVAPEKNLAFLVVTNEADGVGVAATDRVVAELIGRFIVGR